MDVLEQFVEPQGRDGWKEFFELWRRSGKALSAFCRERGLSYHKAQYWRKRLGVVKQRNPRKGLPAAFSPGFAEVLMNSGDSPTTVQTLTIELPRGARICVGDGADLDALRLVLEVLGR